MIKRRLPIFLAALTVMLGIGAVVATPAHAAWENATPGLVCLWAGDGGTGTKRCYAGVSGFCTNINDAPNTHNSFWNRRGADTPTMQADDKHIQIYDGRNCTGQTLPRDPNGDRGPFPSDLRADFYSFVGTSYKNKAESIFFNTG